MRLETIPHVFITLSTLLEVTNRREEIKVLECIHRFLHATAAEIKHLMGRVDLDQEIVDDECAYLVADAGYAQLQEGPR